MKEYGLIFSPPMVCAILEGCKTRTRRLDERWLKVKKADRFWVREAWGIICTQGYLVEPCLKYKADHSQLLINPLVLTKHNYKRHDEWRSSRFMPRWASRILLEATADAYREPLQRMDEDEAKAEGGRYHDGRGIGHSGWRHDPQHGVVYATARESFQVLWDSLNAKHGAGWKSNPTVIVLSFKPLRIETQRIA